MKHDQNNSEKRESNIGILREMAKNRGFSKVVINYVSEFLAERIEWMDRRPQHLYSVIKTETKRAINLTNHLIEKNSEFALDLYTYFGEDSLGLAGKLNDDELTEQAKQCFSSVVECYDNLINNSNKQNEDKKEEYKFLSKNAFKLKEIISHYYKLQGRTNDLINEINFKASINIAEVTDKVLDNINYLKKLDPNSIESQKIKKEIDEDSKFLPKESYTKIKSLTNKILSNYKN